MKTNETNNKVVNSLNKVLSDLQVVYQNLRTMHWLVKGADFYMLHKLYEEFYTETAETVDEVAERVLTLGGVPLHTYADYLAQASLNVVTEVPAGRKSLHIVVENYTHLLQEYRELLASAAEVSDDGTVDLFSGLISSTEKKLWMLNSTLS